MRQVWWLLCAEAAGWKSKMYALSVTVLIIFMIGTVSYVKKQEPVVEQITLGVANEDTSEYATLLLSYFRENDTFQTYVNLVEEAQEELHAALLQGTLDGYLVIPKDFSGSMIRMENLPIQAVVSMKHPARALILRHTMEAYERYIEAVEVNCTALYRIMEEEGFTKEIQNAANVDISMELIFTALGKDEMFRLRRIETQDQASLTEYYSYTAIYFAFVCLLLPAGLQIHRRKKRGMLDRLLSMGITKGTAISAVLVPYTGVILLTVIVLALLSGRQWGTVSVMGVMTVVPWIVLTAFLGERLATEQQYLFCMCIVVVGTAILGGSLIPVQFLPDVFQTIAAWMPNHAFVELFTTVPGGGAWQ